MLTSGGLGLNTGAIYLFGKFRWGVWGCVYLEVVVLSDDAELGVLSRLQHQGRAVHKLRLQRLAVVRRVHVNLQPHHNQILAKCYIGDGTDRPVSALWFRKQPNVFIFYFIFYFYWRILLLRVQFIQTCNSIFLYI